MTPADPLSVLWAARAVAVIGASDRPGALGALPVDFLTRYGYAGRVLPIRPDARPVAGHPAYASVVAACAATGPVDLAMIMVGASNVLAAVEDCIAATVPVAIVCTSGFAETGADGAALQDEVVARARAGGLRIVGPNCIGSVGVASGQVSSFSPLFAGSDTRLVPGELGFVSQSGALGYGAVSLAFDRGIGLGWVVTTGNEADVGAAEVVEAMAAEAGCRGVLGYVEALDARALGILRRVVEAGVPVALVKAGRSEAGAAAAASHTGALATGDRLVDAALRQAGVWRAADVDDLLDVGEVLAAAPPRGRRVAIVTTSGGSGILAADALDAHGLELARLSPPTTAALDEIVPAFGSSANPVDVTATVMSDPTLFDRALDAIADDPGVDAILACFCVLTGGDVDDVVRSLSRVAQRSAVPVLAVRTGAAHLAPLAAAQMRAHGIPCFLTPERGVRALAALHHLGRAVGKIPVGAHCALIDPPADSSEAGVKQWLAGHDIPIPHGRYVVSAPDAQAAIGECGGRAVFKAVVPGLLHKSEAGGVLVDVPLEGAATAYAQIAALGGEVWCEEFVSGGVEALVGVAPSPLGPVLTLGVGGVLTEIMGDVALRVLPVDRSDIEAMIDETRLGALLAGARGAPPADRTALVETVLKLAFLACGVAEPFELDLNPVTVLPAGRGVRVLDALWVAAQPTAAGGH